MSTLHRNGVAGVGGARRREPAPRPAFEPLEARWLLAAPTFVTQFDPHYFLSDGSLAIGLEADDADLAIDDLLTYSVVSQTPGLTVSLISPTDRFALLHFVAADGVTDIGTIVVQLFEDLSPTAADRFITLSLTGFDADGNVDPAAPPFYTNVIVHRVIPGFMIQTGDAASGDGTGGSPLGDFPDAFDPVLKFSGPGVLAMANSGPDTNDCQFFITAAPTAWLNGGYFIFGHMVSPGVDPNTGGSTYETIINSPTIPSPSGEDSLPAEPPILTSVEVLTRADLGGRYGTVLLQSDSGFTGPASLTITVTDLDGNEVSQTISVIVPHQGTAVFAVSGEETGFYVDLAGVTDPGLSSSLAGTATSLDPATGLATVRAPAGYSGAFTLTLSDGGAQVNRYTIISQNPGDPRVQALLPDSEGVRASVQDGVYLYAGLASGGINVYDVTDPAQPVLLANLAYTRWDGADLSGPFDSVMAMRLNGSTLYVTDSDLASSGRLISVDVSDPANPLPLSSAQTADVPYALVLSGRTAFVADYGVGLTAYDISFPAHLKKYARAFTALPNGLTVSEAFSVAVKGQYVYLSAVLSSPAGQQLAGLVVVDAANPANMTFANVLGVNSNLPVSLVVQGDRLYFVEARQVLTNNAFLSVYDVSSAKKPKRLGSVPVPDDSWGLDVRGTLAVVSTGDGKSVVALDVRDPSHMHVHYAFANNTLASGSAIGYPPSLSAALATVPVSGLGTLVMDVSVLGRWFWVDTKKTFLDKKGTPVTIAIQGGGSVKVVTGSTGAIQSIEVFPAGPKTKVTVSTPGKKTSTAGGIVIHGSAGSFSARTLALTGDMTAEGTLSTLVLGNVSGGVTIDIGSGVSGSSSRPVLSVTLGAVSDLRLDAHELVVGSLVASSWLDGDGEAANDMLAAARVDRLTINGAFAAALDIRGTGGKPALGSATIKGGASGDWSITGSTGAIVIRGQAAGLRIAATGSLASLQLGAAVGCDFLAGFASSFTDRRPGDGADFALDLLATIGAIKITGLAVPRGAPVPRFVDDTNFSAARIGKVQLKNVDLGDCGLYALAGGPRSGIQSVKISDSSPLWKTDPGHNWSWSSASPATPAIIHLL